VGEDPCCGTAERAGRAPLALRPADLDPDQCLVLLREKGETVRWQPVSPTLMSRLVQHGQDRHVPASGQLLRYADGRPVTSRTDSGSEAGATPSYVRASVSEVAGA
jgi:hypothetical protein